MPRAGPRVVEVRGDDPWQVCSLALPVRALGRHRITADRYRELRAAQDGVCAICQQANLRGPGAVPLYIDHDHVCCPDHHRTCGQCIRGLLCSGCNGSLGELELWGRLPYGDDGTWEAAALRYLAGAGCDPFDPQRRQAVESRHRERVAKWSEPCRCRVCRPAEPPPDDVTR
ncbi:endonuclease domain-containing protein [Micromonospora costi]|nr:endonuclease domain-containing protein [Micromonospora costi]